MVVPVEVIQAARDGDVAAVRAWLNAGGDVNDRDAFNDTMLVVCAGTPGARTTSHTDVVRLLIERGADVNSWGSLYEEINGDIQPGLSALHYACDRIEDVSADMVSLLLDAKADVHCRTRDAPPEDDEYPEVTPLGRALNHFHLGPAESFPAILRIVTMLLRAGASLDAVIDNDPADYLLGDLNGRFSNLRDDDTFLRTKDMIIGVRCAGSWKQYCRRDHKQILRLRSLVARGRARERLATSRAMKFIVRQGDNGIVWTILSFWQATN